MCLKFSFEKLLFLIIYISYVLDIQGVNLEKSLNSSRHTFNCENSEKSNPFKNVNLKESLDFEGFSEFNDDGRSYLDLQMLRGLHLVLRGCGSSDCYRKRLLQALDRALDADSLQLYDGVYLVKDLQEEESIVSRGSPAEPFLMAVARRVIKLLETHSIRVRLGVMKDAPQARIGHHSYRQAFPLMVGSFMLLAAFMVPMGFQFLAVVGGKALVLSQIALVMAMGGYVQRYFGSGGGSHGSNLGGVVQHDYYLRDELRPWHREGTEGPRDQNPTPQQHLSPQQLQSFLNHQS